MNFRVATFILSSIATCSLLPAQDLPRSAPEAQSVNSTMLLQFVDKLEEIDSLHSLMVVRNGHVVTEGWWAPYGPEDRHQLYSLSKSFTSTAVGLAIEEGKLKLHDPIMKFFPDDLPAAPSMNLRNMRVVDLLRMTTGQQTEPPRTDAEAWTRTFLNHPVPFKPGTLFVYNTSATYMQSAIVQKATGQTLLAYLTPRLFEPLGIKDPTWETSPQGISTGGYGLSIRTEDIAKFGQLYLQKGKWNGKQLIPEKWIQTATARQTSNGSNPQSDWDQGYGYQFWRSRNNAYRGDGAFGQYCIVIPEKNAVVAITSGVKDMQSVLNVVWSELLPAFVDEAMPENESSVMKLRQKLQDLKIAVPENSGTSAAVDKEFTFPENTRKLTSLRFGRDASGREVLTMAFDGVEQRILCGNGEWLRGETAWGGLPPAPTAIAGGWKDKTFTMKICFYEKPFIVTNHFTLDGDSVTLTSESNVAFGPTKQPDLLGTAE
jgi:CubicO group peptidase (beta-lactamase class C family)